MTLTKVQKTRIELTKIAAEILGTTPSADDVARLAFYLEEGQAAFVRSEDALIECGPEPQQRAIVGYVRAKDLWGDDETMTLRILELVGPDAQTFQFKVQPLDEREHDGERHYWSWAPDAWVGLTKISDAAPPDRPMVNAPLE